MQGPLNLSVQYRPRVEAGQLSKEMGLYETLSIRTVPSFNFKPDFYRSWFLYDDYE